MRMKKEPEHASDFAADSYWLGKLKSLADRERAKTDDEATIAAIDMIAIDWAYRMLLDKCWEMDEEEPWHTR